MVVKAGDVWATLVLVAGRVCSVEDSAEAGDIEIDPLTRPRREAHTTPEAVTPGRTSHTGIDTRPVIIMEC